MDLSVFNFLISGNPNASAAENIFSDAAQGDVSGVPDAASEKIRTSDAFLQVLEQVRTGKPEKDADILYNMASARADAASSLKDLKKGGASREDVKVVKLHIKRTRASETLRKADEKKAADVSVAQQNGQKIPTRENIAAAPENTTVRPETNNAPEASETAGFEEIVLPEEAVAPQEFVLPENEDLTAADILITSALQTTFAPLSQTRPETAVRPVEETDTASERIFRDEDNVPVLQPEKIAAPQKADAPAEAEIAPEAEKTAKTEEAEDPHRNIFAVSAPETDDRPVVREKAESKTVLKETPQTLETETEEADFRPVVKTDEKKTATPRSVKPVETAATVKQNETTDVEENTFFETGKSDREARRQAEQLAQRLPVGNKIAISVEVQTPVAKTDAPSHKESRRLSGINVNEDAPESDLPVLTEENASVDARPEEKTLQSVRSEQPVRRAEDQLPDGRDALTVPAPVQNNKAISDTSVVTETAQSGVGETSASPTAQPSAAPFSVGHELKGKAVSGSAPVQKNVPVNELVDQIKVNIKKALKEGLDKIDIVLKPKELGTIKIHLEIGKDGTMKAVLNTARAETLDLLQSDLSALKQALADSGFDLNDQSFSFNYRGERYDGEQKQPKNGRHDFSAEPADDEDAEESAGNLSISGRYALNIRV